MRGRKHDVGRFARSLLSRDVNCRGCMRIEQVAVGIERGADRFGRLFDRSAAGIEFGADTRKRFRLDGEGA